MVNNKLTSELFQILNKSEKPVSGEYLCRQFDISRVAVWKHMQKLKESGIPIESTKRGYQIVGDPDLLSSWNLSIPEDRIHYFPVCDSTMIEAEELAKSEQYNHIVLAERQLQGKGQKDRNWESHTGGLYFTLVKQGRTSWRRSYLYTIATSVAVSRVLKQSGLEPQVKWPNDVLVNSKKITGILLNAAGEPSALRYVNIGIGLNINQDFSDQSKTSMASETGKKFHRQKILRSLYAEIQKCLKDLNHDTLVSEWLSYSPEYNKTVTVQTGETFLQGLFKGIDHTGALILKNGQNRTFYSDTAKLMI